MAHVMIVDDERELGKILATLLRERGHNPLCFSSAEPALASVFEQRPDIVLLDLMLGDTDGMEVLRRLQSSAPGIPVIMMTAYGNVQASVTAMKLGAVDFITKPFKNQDMICTVEAVLSMGCCRQFEPGSTIVGESPLFIEAVELARKFAVPDLNALILGETGTGKEVFARSIHESSKRSAGPFVPVDCSTLSENLFESELFGHEKGTFTGATESRIGRFELAQGGTLFLDEIGNLPVPLQAKLLRVLQERRMERVGGRKTIKLDVRVISATNVNIEKSLLSGEFRQDLYYRLNEISISLPPLRARDGDICRLSRHFVRKHSAQFGKKAPGISDAAMKLMEGYRWPGNVRELENAIKAAVVMAGDTVSPAHLPPEIQSSASIVHVHVKPHEDEDRFQIEVEIGLNASEIDLKAVGAEAAERAERSLLSALVQRCHVSRSQMAKMLNVDPKTLRAKMRKFGIERIYDK